MSHNFQPKTIWLEIVQFSSWILTTYSVKIKGDINTTKNENSKFPLECINILVCKIRPGLEDIILNIRGVNSPQMPYAEAKT